MKTFVRLSILVAALAVTAFGAEKGQKSTRGQGGVYKGSGTPVQTNLNINNITSWVRADGFFDWAIEGSWNGTFPKGTIGAIFSEGIVWGGFVNDGQTPVLRVGGSTYRTGMVAGAILTDASGNVTGREDPGAADVRIYRVRPDWQTGDLRDDAANLLFKRLDQVTDDDIASLRAQYLRDWLTWPAGKGAPYDDRNGVPGYNPDPDGRAKDPQTGGLFDVPGIVGADQTVWFVANDLGPNATVYGAPSIGLEIQMTLWAYSSELFSNVIFKRSRLIYKGSPGGPANATINDMYIAQWSDPDLGEYSDDYVGFDTTLSLGYVYQSSRLDPLYFSRYGLPPPSMGYDFLQGVIVPGAPTDTAIFNFSYRPGYKNLPMTTSTYFAAGSPRDDPDLGRYSGTLQWYNLMRGCEPRPEYPSCTPFFNHLGQATRFELSGDPVAGTGDLDGRILAPGDRRLVLATGPFTMARGDTQEVVLALVGGLGGDNLSSVSIMKANDVFAQSAYDKLFQELPGAPPPPLVNVVELDREIVLDWGSDLDVVKDIEQVDRQGWRFEGYNVYQLPSATARFPEDAVKLATYDLVNNVRAITNRVFDPVAKIFIDKIRQVGNDSGIKRYHQITRDALTGRPLVNGQTYYFVVTAYSYNGDPTVDFHALESRVQLLAVLPQSPRPGIRLFATVGEVIQGEHVSGESDGTLTGVVVDPTALTGHVYRVEFREDTSLGIVWRLIDTTRNVVRLADQTNQSGDDAYAIVDGIMFKMQGPPLEGKDWEADPADDRWFTAGHGADGELLFGGVYLGPNFTGTTVEPGDHTTVEIRFSTKTGYTDTNGNGSYDVGEPYTVDPTKSQNAFMYRTWGGGNYRGFFPVPFTAWDVDVSPPRQLNVVVRDRNRNSQWDLHDDDVSPYEYVWILATDYDPTGAMYDPNQGGIDLMEHNMEEAPVYWALWLGQRGNREPYGADVTLRLIPNRVNVPGDVFTIVSKRAASYDLQAAKSDIERINVFPNPYYGFNARELDRLQKYVTFNHLPRRATVRIFNLGGVLVRTLEKDDDSQFMRWDLRNRNNLPVASGIYIVHIDIPSPISKTKILKLAIVQEEQILRIY